jgi:hypothetical protein
MARFLSVSLGAALVLALSACGRPYVVQTPPGFVEFEDRYEGDEYRAATADGVVLGVRAYDNEPTGALEFWVRAIQNRLRDQGGYALLGTQRIVDRAGLQGQLMKYGHDEEKTPHVYWVAVYVDGDRVWVLEAGGTKELVDRQEPQLNWWLTSFLHQ